MFRKLRYFLLILWMMCLCHGLYADEAPGRSITEAQWQQLTSNKAFNYKNEKEKVWESHRRQPIDLSWLEYVMWGIVILAVIFAFYMLITNNSFSLLQKRSMVLAENPNNDEPELVSGRWEEYFNDAVRKNDVRMAIRYSYMWLLQLLQTRELITYRNDKTNYDYTRELKDSAFGDAFRRLSRQYEYSWYGHYDLPQQSYAEYLKTFNEVKNQLS